MKNSTSRLFRATAVLFCVTAAGQAWWFSGCTLGLPEGLRDPEVQALNRRANANPRIVEIMEKHAQWTADHGPLHVVVREPFTLVVPEPFTLRGPHSVGDRPHSVVGRSLGAQAVFYCFQHGSYPAGALPRLVAAVAEEAKAIHFSRTIEFCDLKSGATAYVITADGNWSRCQ